MLWPRERWRRLYLREPVEQVAWHWWVRGLRNLLIQTANDDGFLAGSREVLRRAFRGDEQFDQAVEILLGDGFLVEDDHGIWIRNLPEAQGDPAPSMSSAKTAAASAARWARVSSEQRAEAARRAASARWKRAQTDASPPPQRTHADASTDALTDALTDASDASVPRAVSGQDQSSGSLKPARIARRARQDGSEIHADAVDPRTHTYASTDASASDASATDVPDASDATDASDPKNLKEALAIPISARARLVVRRPDMASWIQPERWPEVRKALDAFRDATNQPNLPTLPYSADRGVQAIVALLAADPPISSSQLCAGIRAAVASDWWNRDGKRRGLASLTIEVLRRALQSTRPEPAPGPDPLDRALEAAGIR